MKKKYCTCKAYACDENRICVHCDLPKRHLKKKKFNRKDAYTDFMNIVLAVYMKITKRCMLEGCRYGYFPKDKLADNCMYCDQPRQIFENFGDIVSLRKELETLSKHIK